VRRVQRLRLRHLAQTRLWLVPLACLLVGIGLAVALLSVDRSSGFHMVGTSVTGSAASVQTILTAASTALVTLTSVVLSLTLVAVQLAMGQFSPRIVRAILHDRRSQLAVGLFIGTFAYSMTVLREVNGQSSGGASVPGLAVVVDYALILSAIIVLVLYVHHTAQSIRVGGLLGWVADTTRTRWTVFTRPRPTRRTRAWWRRPTPGWSPCFRTTCSWTSPRRLTACWSWSPRWAILCLVAARSSVCRAPFQSRVAARPRAA
jgi:uncharacterized membrane protein